MRKLPWYRDSNSLGLSIFLNMMLAPAFIAVITGFLYLLFVGLMPHMPHRTVLGAAVLISVGFWTTRVLLIFAGKA